LREKKTDRVFENRVLRKIVGFMRVEVTGRWKRLHNAELYDLYSTGVIKSRKMRCVVGGGERGVNGFVGNASGKETT